MGIYINPQLGFVSVAVAAAPATGPAAPFVIAGALGFAALKLGLKKLFTSRRGQVKRDTAQIADENFPLIRDYMRRFFRGEITKAQALYLMDAVWDEMVSQWREYDRVNRTTQGARSISSQRVFFLQNRDPVARAPERKPPTAAVPRGPAPPVIPTDDIAGVLPWIAAAGAAYFFM